MPTLLDEPRILGLAARQELARRQRQRHLMHLFPETGPYAGSAIRSIWSFSGPVRRIVIACFWPRTAWARRWPGALKMRST